MDNQLWGTFSVADHLRRTPFVADVLLFDRLIVPVPTNDDFSRWDKKEHWDPARQRRLLDTLKDGNSRLVQEVPWSPSHRNNWEKQMTEASDTHAIDRRAATEAAAGDVRDIQNIRKVDPDRPAYSITRRYLKNVVDAQVDDLVVKGVPPGRVQVVTAYGTYQNFAAENDVGTSPLEADDEMLSAFAWPFVVPVPATGGQLTEHAELDLLKRAIDFASEDHSIQYRRLFHAWRVQQLLDQKTPDEAAKDISDQIVEYHKWARAQKWRKRIRYSFIIGGPLIVAGGMLAPVLWPAAAAFAIPITGAGAVGTVAPVVPEIWGGPVRRKRRPANDGPELAGALFWQWRESLRRSPYGKLGFRPG
jgi:hypothetical protein